MIYLLTVIHVLVCFMIIGVILLQPGTGADLAGAFGGQGSQTAFGPRGTVNILTKVTAWLAVLFALTSIFLTILVARQGSGHSVLNGIPTQSSSKQPARRGK